MILNKMNTHTIYIFILNLYNISNTALAYAVTFTEGEVQPAAFHFTNMIK